LLLCMAWTRVGKLSHWSFSSQPLTGEERGKKNWQTGWTERNETTTTDDRRQTTRKELKGDEKKNCKEPKNATKKDRVRLECILSMNWLSVFVPLFFLSLRLSPCLGYPFVGCILSCCRMSSVIHLLFLGFVALPPRMAVRELLLNLALQRVPCLGVSRGLVISCPSLCSLCLTAQRSAQ
jgi:hypothetical protein